MTTTDPRVVPAASFTEEAPDPRTRIFTVTGEIDLAIARTLRLAVLAAIERSAHNVVIDLTATAFIDSSGLAIFISAYKRLVEIDGRFVIVNTHPGTMKVFEVTGLDRVFSIVTTRRAALAQLADHSS